MNNLSFCPQGKGLIKGVMLFNVLRRNENVTVQHQEYFFSRE